VTEINPNILLLQTHIYTLKRDEKIRKLGAIYFLLLAVLYIVYASIEFGGWGFNNSDTYVKICEAVLISIILKKAWYGIIRLVLILQIILLLYIFIGGYGGKVISVLSLVVLFLVDFSHNYFTKSRSHNKSLE